MGPDPSRCILYVTDRGYLFPTLVSALQARRRSRAADVDVVVCLHGAGLDAAERDALEGLCASSGLVALDVNADVVRSVARVSEGVEAFAGRIPATSLVPLLMDELLPARYEDVLYVDGDTQVVDDLRPLLDHPLPPGRLMAARDYWAVVAPFEPPWADGVAAHLDALGLSPAQRMRYFNTGVMRAARSTWRRVGRAALDFCTARRGRDLDFVDQSALNAVAADELLLMSLRWNFPKQFLGLAAGGHLIADRAPAIVHYMGNPKPWHGRFPPWDRTACAPYDALGAAWPALAGLRPRLGPVRRAGYRVRHAREHRFGRRWHPDATVLREALYPPDTVA